MLHHHSSLGTHIAFTKVLPFDRTNWGQRVTSACPRSLNKEPAELASRSTVSIGAGRRRLVQAAVAAVESGDMKIGYEIKVLGSWSSPYVVRVRIALEVKGIEYEFLPQAFGTKREMVRLYNPVYKKIPVLLHNGRPIAESMIIINYLDEAFSGSGPSLLPLDPYDRAIARFWTVYFDDKWFSSLKATAIAESEDSKAAAAEYVVEVLQRLEGAFKECSKGKEFFGGDTIGYLDIAIGSHLGWLGAVEKMTGVKYLDEEKMPLLAGWAERFLAHPAVKELIPEEDRLIEFANQLQAKLRAEATAAKKGLVCV